MVRIVLVASALALSAPAIAQEATPATEEAPQTAPAAPAEAAPAQPTVAEVVKAEFPSYDADSSGDLSKAEFSKWVIALKTKADPSAAADAAALNDWADKAFASADADKSAAVSEEELTSFLGG